MQMLKESVAKETQMGQTKLPLMISDQTELKTMVDAIAVASQREAEAHEMAVFLSNENDELRKKIKVLIEDNNKLIDLYEKAVAEDKELKMGREEVESLKCQLSEMHEENDKLLSLYEKAMQERDELKKVIASSQCKNRDDKVNFSCPEKLEIDGGQCLSFDEASVCLENEHKEGEMNSIEPNMEKGNTDTYLETPTSELHVQTDYSQCSMDTEMSNSSDSNEADMKIDELDKPDEADGGKSLEMMREKLVEAQEKLSYSAETVSIFGSFERAMIEIDALSERIGELDCSIQSKRKECEYLRVLSSELWERKDLADKKLSALKYSLKNFSSSVGYFAQREALTRSKLNASSNHVSQKKEELNSLLLSKNELMNGLSKAKETENNLRNVIADMRLKVEDENRKLEGERVLFAIDNVEKAGKSWQVSGKATALLESEEKKTKLQSQMKVNREALGGVKKEIEAMHGKLQKLESERQGLEMEIQKEMGLVDELNVKLRKIVEEKEMLLEVEENGKAELERMIIDYYQSLFEAELKGEEEKIMQEEMGIELEKIRVLQGEKGEAIRRKTQLVEAMSIKTCFVSDKVEADLQSLRTSVVELNSLIQHCV